MENSLANPSEAVEDPRPLRALAHGKAGLLGNYSALLRTIGLGFPLILLCVPIFRDLLDLWWNRYGFSHGFLVPLVSLYLVWLQLPTLRQVPITPALGPGLLWLVASTVLLLASEVAGILTTGGLALILVLAGLVLLLCGVAYLKALAFPLGYLIFMTPVLDLLTEPLEWPFQLLTANMSVSMLQTLGIPVFLENDVFIILPAVTLEVARECSGAGLLIAVLAIGLPLGSLTLQAWWSRITLVLSSVMIAIAANWLRLTVMGIYAQTGGKDLHGPYHILQGLFVDWVAFAFLFAAAWLLGRLERGAPMPLLCVKRKSSSELVFQRATWNRAWWLACSTLAVATLVLYSVESGATEIKKDLATFPALIGDWIVDHQPNKESIVNLPENDESLTRTYRRPDGRRVSLYVAYTKRQRQGKELVGLQTAPLHAKAVRIALRVGEEKIPANRTVIDTSSPHTSAVFWYYINGTGYADRYLTKLATIKQAFLHGRTDGALVLVIAESRTGESEEPWKAQEEFAGTVFPLLREYVP